MAIWIQIEKTNSTVKVEGNLFAVGQKLAVGLGSIELRETPKAGLHMVRLSGSGHFKYSLALRRDGRYRMGPDRGHRVVEAHEEENPIKRVLRELDLPISLIRKSESPPSNDWGWKMGSGFGIPVSYGHYLNGSAWMRPQAVFIWGDADPEELREKLLKAMYGDEADAGFPAALQNPEEAKIWIASRFGVPHRSIMDKNILVFPCHKGGNYCLQVEDGIVVHETRNGVANCLTLLAFKHGVGLISWPE